MEQSQGSAEWTKFDNIDPIGIRSLDHYLLEFMISKLYSKRLIEAKAYAFDLLASYTKFILYT
jgi:hypothetical protein